MTERSTGGLRTFFTIARFGPDSIFILSLLIVMALVLYAYGFRYLSITSGVVFILILIVESFETIRLEKLKRRQIIGAKCLVIKKISRAERGIVRLYDSEGNLDGELWSAESESKIEKGGVAVVSGIKSIVLEVKPEVKEAKTLSSP